MGYSDVRAFPLHLATEEGVAASTQNQALNALLFLYREVLAVIKRLSNMYRLAAQLLYGNGLRLMECMQFTRSVWRSSWADCYVQYAIIVPVGQAELAEGAGR